MRTKGFGTLEIKQLMIFILPLIKTTVFKEWGSFGEDSVSSPNVGNGKIENDL